MELTINKQILAGIGKLLVMNYNPGDTLLTQQVPHVTCQEKGQWSLILVHFFMGFFMPCAFLL